MTESEPRLLVVPDAGAMSQMAADAVSGVLSDRPESALSLPTGRTPLGMFDVLIARSRAGAVDLSQMQLFCLDEYLGVDVTAPNTLTSLLTQSLIVPAGIPLENVHTLPVRDPDPEGAALRYEEEMASAGGLQLVVLGLGNNGHVAYNEPGSDVDSRTRVVDLTQASLDQAEKYFSGNEVPTKAMTVGIGTLLEANAIVLIVSGSAKQEILKRTLQVPISAEVPASWLRLAGDRVTIIADREAAASLG